MANKDAMLEALEEIENGMCRIKERRSIWQNSLIYALCQAVRLLLIDKIKEERRLTRLTPSPMPVCGELKTT